MISIGTPHLHVTAPPVCELGYPDDVWTCPVTGEVVPKDIRANGEWRAEVAVACEHNRAKQIYWQGACAASPLLWLNQFAWTYRPKSWCADGVERAAGTVWIDDQGRRHTTPVVDSPLITWPAQDKLVAELVDCIGSGRLVLVDKSREQGATVIILATLTWAWLYQPRFSALLASRKADLVEAGSAASDQSLLGRVDQIIKRLPYWMTPKHSARHDNMPSRSNRSNGALLIGESANQDIGQSMRTTIAFVDEAARFPDQDGLVKSLESVALSTILASTPAGPGTTFSKLRRKADTPDGRKAIRVVTLGYWDHPQMGAGRQWRVDVDGTVTGKAGSGYWDTPVFRTALARSASPRDIRENWLIDHETSGAVVIDSNAISRLRPGVLPGLRGSLVVQAQGKLPTFEPGDGRLILWCPLINGAPPRDDNYIISVDVAQGVEGSNTVFAITSRGTGRQVAEYADPTISPQDAATFAAALGYWFAGQLGQAFIIWERNGPGMSFGHELVRRLHYPFLYYQRDEDQRQAKKTRQWGWQSTTATREILFGALNSALRSGEFSTPCEAGLDDMAAWMFDDYGRIVCGSQRDLSTGAQARHGDRAIAYALSVFGRREAPQYVPERPRFAPGTMGAIMGLNNLMDRNYELADPFK